MSEVFETLRAFPNLLQSIGVFGFLMYISTFLAIQHGRLCGNSIAFSTYQVTAATCVLISLIGAFNLASLLIQVSYITIGLYGISRRRNKAMAPSRQGATRPQVPSSV